MDDFWDLSNKWLLDFGSVLFVVGNDGGGLTLDVESGNDNMGVGMSLIMDELPDIDAVFSKITINMAGFWSMILVEPRNMPATEIEQYIKNGGDLEIKVTLANN